LGYLIGRRRGTVFRKQTAQGVGWLQNRRIAGLREHRIDRRPNERVGRYAFFLSEHDQLRLFARFRLSFAVCRSNVTRSEGSSDLPVGDHVSEEQLRKYAEIIELFRQENQAKAQEQTPALPSSESVA
jgi:hypothetical protein